MDKVIDHQNPRKGAFVRLAGEEKRVRVEVTLDRRELQKLGLRRLGDLWNFKFTTLQGEFFKFMLPSFEAVDAAPFSQKKAIRLWQEKQRERKFLTSGVIGLQVMDSVLERRAGKVRLEARKRLRSQNRILKPWRQQRLGKHGTLVAFEELNKRIEAALRELSRRMEAGACRD